MRAAKSLRQPEQWLAAMRRQRSTIAPLHTLLLWLVIAALAVLGALPGVVHCDRKHAETTTTSEAHALRAWFLCDLPASAGLPAGTAMPHHHHVAPQLPVEPALAFVGLVAPALLLTGRLLLFLRCQILLLLFAPPTPPPRLLG